MSRAVLSHPLPVFGLVGFYPANYLIGHSPIPDQQAFGRRAIQPDGIIRY